MRANNFNVVFMDYLINTGFTPYPTEAEPTPIPLITANQIRESMADVNIPLPIVVYEIETNYTTSIPNTYADIVTIAICNKLGDTDKKSKDAIELLEDRMRKLSETKIGNIIIERCIERGSIQTLQDTQVNLTKLTIQFAINYYVEGY